MVEETEGCRKGEEVFFFFLELRTVRIDDVANENRELGVLSRERERERVTKRFLVTQRKLKLKTLGD